MHIAVARENLNDIDCLRRGIDINAIGADGLTPIHWAIVKDAKKMVDRDKFRPHSIDIKSDSLLL